MAEKWALRTRIAADRGPFRDLRLTAALILSYRRRGDPHWLRHFGIQVSAEAHGITRLRLPGGLTLFAPPLTLAPEEILVDGAFPSPAAETLGHFLTVSYADQYEACRALAPGDTVLDLGANVGAFTLLASRLVGPAGRVLAVEPIAANLACLDRMIAANKLANVEVIPAAVGDHDGEITITLDPRCGGHSAKKHSSTVSVQAPLRTVDSLLAERSAQPRFLKADVEGMEAEVLLGARRTLAGGKPRLALSAYHLAGDAERLPALIRSLRSDYQVEVRQLHPMLEPVVMAR